ncbi:MAG: polynucleotide adenylyltransferase PcnB [Acidobacteria bacterium]|nr:polynucleotide adenylyltransferase PcnB [Acidobacteriota bacterium]
MPRNVVKVLGRLNKAGYRAYLVGGSVRDLMLGRQPKDFDAGTDAKPAEIRRLFRNSRIIGRRFRLAHIFFQDEVIEVATFRREPDEDEQESAPGELLITSDNSFGSPRQDAFRRDFTINALFYNIDDFTIIDYVGGIDDLEKRTIRCIGDPSIRFREDPVRMLRACEFAGRLGFGIETKTQQAILDHCGELTKASTARLTEELLQLLRSGHAGAVIQWMLDLGIVEVLLPEVLEMVVPQEHGAGDLSSLLPALDAAVTEGRELSDSALVATILLPAVLGLRGRLEAQRRRALSRSEVASAVDRAVAAFQSRYALPKLKGQGAVDALVVFQRLCEPGWTVPQRRRFATAEGFDDALALFELMVDATGEGGEALDAWREAARQRVASKPAGQRTRNRRRRRRGRGGRTNSDSQSRTETV